MIRPSLKSVPTSTSRSTLRCSVNEHLLPTLTKAEWSSLTSMGIWTSRQGFPWKHSHCGMERNLTRGRGYYYRCGISSSLFYRTQRQHANKKLSSNISKIRPHNWSSLDTVWEGAWPILPISSLGPSSKVNTTPIIPLRKNQYGHQTEEIKLKNSLTLEAFTFIAVMSLIDSDEMGLGDEAGTSRNKLMIKWRQNSCNFVFGPDIVPRAYSHINTRMIESTPHLWKPLRTCEEWQQE